MSITPSLAPPGAFLEPPGAFLQDSATHIPAGQHNMSRPGLHKCSLGQDQDPGNQAGMADQAKNCAEEPNSSSENS